MFEDSKGAERFYNHINITFKLEDEKSPFDIEVKQYFISFYEVEIQTKTVNLVSIVFDGLLAGADIGYMLGDALSSRRALVCCHRGVQRHRNGLPSYKITF